MDSALDMLPLRSSSGDLNAIVETPRGSRVKFSYDKQTGRFWAKKLLAPGYAFPFPFGFLPSTKAEDGDPIDVMIFTYVELPMGALVQLALIGVIEIEEKESGRTIRNDRLIGMPLLEGDDDRAATLADIGEAPLREIERFLIGYQEAEGKIVRLVGRRESAEAERLVEQARQ